MNNNYAFRLGDTNTNPPRDDVILPIMVWSEMEAIAREMSRPQQNTSLRPMLRSKAIRNNRRARSVRSGARRTFGARKAAQSAGGDSDGSAPPSYPRHHHSVVQSVSQAVSIYRNGGAK